jgi:hypothetical protein
MIKVFEDFDITLVGRYQAILRPMASPRS